MSGPAFGGVLLGELPDQAKGCLRVVRSQAATRLKLARQAALVTPAATTAKGR